MTVERPSLKHQATVLVVDDNPSNLGVLFDSLEHRGYRVLVALGGDQALKQLDRVQPDVILLDVLMPGTDGFETCMLIKSQPRCRHIPVIFMSALTDPEDKVRAFEAGAVDYITKPMNEREVLARVDTQVSLRALRRELEQSNELLREQRRQLAIHNDDLSAFGHSVAHDLEDHLGGILQYTAVLMQRLRETGQPVELADLQLIHDTGVEMTRVFDSLVLLGGVSSQQVANEPLDMGEIVDRVTSELSPIVTARNATIDVPDAWPAAIGYGPWIERVWSNLLSNGIKYGGDPPRLQLGAERVNAAHVRFWVRDNGPGIPPEDRSAVFQPFKRLQTERTGGQGLGLTIVCRVVEKLGGEVGVESLDAGGSEFHFTLPGAPE